MLEAAEQVAGIGSLEWIPEIPRLRWSDNLYRLFGLEPGEVEPSREFWYERIHPDDRQLVDDAIERWERNGEVTRILEYRWIRPDGALRHFRNTTSLFNGSDGRTRIIGPIQDVTELRGAERQIAAHLAVSEALATWESLEQGAPDLLRRLATAMDFEVGVLWLPEDRVLAPRFFWQSSALDDSEFETVTRQLRFPRGSGLPGRAWEAQQPIASARDDDQGDFERRSAEQFCMGVAFPAVTEGATAAVLEFYLRADANLTEPQLRSLAGIGHELGRFLSRRGGELSRARSLTRREIEVLQHAANGLSGRRIAEQLVVSPSTIKTHFNHIYEKLGVSSRSGAVAVALRLGLIE